jgi:hypothetical protein
MLARHAPQGTHMRAELVRRVQESTVGEKTTGGFLIPGAAKKKRKWRGNISRGADFCDRDPIMFDTLDTSAQEATGAAVSDLRSSPSRFIFAKEHAVADFDVEVDQSAVFHREHQSLRRLPPLCRAVFLGGVGDDNGNVQ